MRTNLFTELKRRNVFRVGIAYIVVAWLLLQVADVVLNNITAPGWVFQAIMLVMGLGFPITLIFAWAFEMTPEGIKKEKDVDRNQSITPTTGRKLDYTIIALLVLALGYFIWESRFESDSGTAIPADEVTGEESVDATTSDEMSIAVLPFVNMSADADNEYFSDGISEELLNVMVRVNSLTVASRTSSFAYKGKDLAVKQIASELGVNHILEGSVRKAGNTVRITAQLIDTATDRHLWSETYERELDDIFDIQEEISNAIVDALKIALNVDETHALERVQRPTDNAEAYELYLQGRHLWRTRQEANIREGITLFKRAIELDPKYAKAYEALSVATLVLPAWSDEIRSEALVKGLPYAQKALQLDPTLAEAHAVMAEIYSENHQWAEMMDAYEAAIAHEPKNATVHQWYGENLNNSGFQTNALEELKVAYTLDPAAGVISRVLVLLSSMIGDNELAHKHQAIALSLGLKERGGNMLPTYIREEDWSALQRTINIDGPLPVYAATCIEALKDSAMKSRLNEELKAALPLDWRGYFDVLCAGVAGDIELALDIAIAATRESWPALKLFWGNTPNAAQMRNTQRFKDLLTEMGLVDFYREYGWPDHCRPLETEDFTCD
jgi:TolB-like protein